MQQEPESNIFETNQLVKEVQGHLFTFEEKMFGMSLQQLLTDIGVFTSSFSFTGSLPLIPHLIVSVLITLLAMVVVHGKIQGIALGYWLYLLLRFKMTPSRAIWQSKSTTNDVSGQQDKHRLPSVQMMWVPVDTLQHGVGAKREQHKKTEMLRYWMAFEVEGKNIRLLPDNEQIRVFRRFERFLTGLEFHLQLLSYTEQVNPRTAPALQEQKEALLAISATPKIQALQKASIQAQEKEMTVCTQTRHFIIVSASEAEAALRNPDGTPRSVLSTILRLFTFRKKADITPAEILDQLRIRASVVRKAMQQVDMQVWPLQDQNMTQLLAQCLAPGSTELTFLPEVINEQTLPVSQQKPRGDSNEEPEGQVADDTSPLHITRKNKQDAERPPTLPPPPRKSSVRKSVASPTYKNRLRGVHGTFYYTGHQKQARSEAGIPAIADLIAPSSIEMRPDVMQIQAGKQTRYARSFTVTGYGHHLLCGWVNNLHDLGMPLLISTHFEPVDSRFMIMKLEHALTRLESQRLTDQKTLRITKVDQTIETEQIRRVARALASKRLKIFEVSLTICVHASSPERLEQRARYLLSHLRDMQIQARPAMLQQDLAWQSCLPIGLDLLQTWVKLTSDVASTMMPGTSGTVGTPTGVFLGYTGSGLARRPIYFNPWSRKKKIPNPHIVVIGETGRGKSWLGKSIATGFIGLGLADVAVLDKDDDYLRLHRAIPGESQRYNLARSCPLNLFDIPFGPADVDMDDPADILSEFFDNSLLTGLSLLVNEENTRLSKSEEAYLITVARATYAEKGITSEAIRLHPETLLLPAPTLADFIAKMQEMPASSDSMRQSLLERLEKASYLFQAGQTTVSLEKPLTIFSIKGLDEKWFALMTYVVQNFLMRHRALKKDKRYLAYIVEEASFLLKHPAGRRYLENASRSFRKLGISLITLSQQPDDFLDAGQVVLSNAGTVFYLGMQETAIKKLNLPEELERILGDSSPGECVLRMGNEYVPLTIWSNPVYGDLFKTDPIDDRPVIHEEQAS